MPLVTIQYFSDNYDFDYLNLTLAFAWQYLLLHEERDEELKINGIICIIFSNMENQLGY
jgi:hypothetical protein